MSGIRRIVNMAGLVMSLGVIVLLVVLPVAAIRVPVDPGQLTDWTYPDDPLVSVFGLLFSGSSFDEMTDFGFTLTITAVILGPVLVLFSRLRHLRENDMAGASVRAVLAVLTILFLVQIPSFGTYALEQGGYETLFTMRVNWIWMFITMLIWGVVEIVTLVFFCWTSMADMMCLRQETSDMTCIR